MTFDVGYFLLGALLIAVALLASFVKRLPFTETIIYLSAGALLGPLGFGLVSLDAHGHAHLLERLAEIAVIVSLFTTGLKLRVPLRDGRWRVPIRLGAVLAPTDPVLASDVQLEHAHDRDRLRFSLTGEAELNDRTAFPFVMLGLGLLRLHKIGAWGWRWFAVKVLWYQRRRQKRSASA